MTAAHVMIPGIRRSVAATPSVLTEVTLFTAGEKGATLAQVVIANITSTAADATVKWGDGSADYAIYFEKSIPANDSLVAEHFIELPVDGEINITAGTVDALTFTVTVIENIGAIGSGQLR